MGSRAAVRATAAARRQRRRRARKWRAAAVGVVALLGVAGAASLWRATWPRATIPVGAPLPPFALVDQAARPLTRATLAGHVVVVGFACFHDVLHAPRALAAVRALADDTRRAGLAAVDIVTLTAAPDEDTPDHLPAVAAAAGATPPWSFASGTVADVTSLLDALAVDWRRLAAERATYGTPIFPDDRLLLVDRQGRLRGEYDGTSWTALRRLRAELALVAAEPH
jgi:cytochrome oxidase Cu insertion factor (SCO1/SenC/PrrC family)